MNGAIYVENSKNSKLLSNKYRVDSTYVSINSSCPKNCILKNKGCYGQTSYSGIINVRLDNESKNCTAIKVAKAEAEAIDNSYKSGLIPDDTYLRLHVIGDSRTLVGTRLINSAVKRWLNRNGKLAYGYTHSWKNVPKIEWSNVSMLASIDRVEQNLLARENGYATTIVVSKHLRNKAYKLPNSDVSWIPCLAQLNKEIGCADCQLCFNCDYLYNKNIGIAFEAHGVRKNTIKNRLKFLKL